MRWGNFLIGFLTLTLVAMLIVYFFLPFNTTEFSFNSKPTNSNFSLNGSQVHMQFYDNMRFPSNRISYKIYDCPLQKKANMEEGFDIIQNLTVLEFYEVDYGEEISVNCDDNVKVEGGLFIAGEGGPTNITVSGDFNVIYNGKILLIRESSCPFPNVAIHELLHVLGFDHSKNPDNIMYEVSKCGQTVGEEIPALINELYSFPNLPDLIFENASIEMSGKYLNANLSIRNNGLLFSESSELVVYADEKPVKRVEIEPLDIGYGTKLSLYNIWVNKLNVNQIKIVLENSFEELDKTNNKIIFDLKE